MKTLFLLVAIVWAVGCEPVTPTAETGSHGIAPTNNHKSLKDLSVIHGKRIKNVWVGKVVKTSDGDTVTVLTEKKEQIKIRLEAIDTPETKQPFGSAAKKKLASLIHGKLVTVHQTGKDRYGRVLAFLRVSRSDVNAAMIRSGMAWHFKTYNKSATLADLENEARAAKRGLWSNTSYSDQIPPWLWRKGARSRKEITLENGQNHD